MNFKLNLEIFFMLEMLQCEIVRSEIGTYVHSGWWSPYGKVYEQGTINRDERWNSGTWNLHEKYRMQNECQSRNRYHSRHNYHFHHHDENICSDFSTSLFLKFHNKISISTPLNSVPHHYHFYAVSSTYEGLKKALNAHETGRELDDNEKRLKHNERYFIT